MKRKMSLFLAVIMLISIFMISACSKNEGNEINGPDSQGESDGSNDNVNSNTPDEDDQGEGNEGAQREAYVPDKPVTIVYAGWENPLQNAIIMDEFMKKHENIIVEPYEGGFINEEELTKLAAANAMPDIVAINDLGLAAKNNWLIDLKPFFDEDPGAEAKTYSNITDMTTINDKLYVLATGIFLNGLNVNKDLIEANNLKVPDYDWTVDEAVDIIKACTVKGESLGCLNLDWIITMVTGSIGRPEIGRSCVNSETKRFEMDEEFIKTTSLFKELFDAKVSLWEQADEIGRPWEFEEDSPEAVAAEEARTDYMMETIGTVEDGWAVGKTSMQDFPTHLIGWAENNPRGAEHAYAGFDYDFYPFPRGSEEDHPRFQIITDFAGITPSSEDPKAAYEFLRYITYDEQGYLDRVEVMKGYDQQEFMERYPEVPEEFFIEDPERIFSSMGAGMNIIPASNTDTARDAYRDFHHEGTPDGSPGISYLLDYIETGYLDLHRALPGYNEAWGYVRGNIFDQIIHGSKTPADIAKELEEGANRILDEWNAAIEEAN